MAFLVCLVYWARAFYMDQPTASLSSKPPCAAGSSGLSDEAVDPCDDAGLRQVTRSTGPPPGGVANISGVPPLKRFDSRRGVLGVLGASFMVVAATRWALIYVNQMVWAKPLCAEYPSSSKSSSGLTGFAGGGGGGAAWRS